MVFIGFLQSCFVLISVGIEIRTFILSISLSLQSLGLLLSDAFSSMKAVRVFTYSSNRCERKEESKSSSTVISQTISHVEYIYNNLNFRNTEPNVPSRISNFCWVSTLYIAIEKNSSDPHSGSTHDFAKVPYYKTYLPCCVDSNWCISDDD